jgi:AcrR family transcriptional regulator
MERIMATVNTSRKYDSTGRQAQARRSRERVIQAARRQLLAAGYGSATIAAIAREAGVSVEMIYKTFGGKPGLVRAIYERALEGRGPTPAYERSDEMRSKETDPRMIMRKWGDLGTEVLAEGAPIMLLIHSAAATDPEMAELLAESDADRLKRMRHHARFLAARRYLRSGVTIAQATDVLWTCSSTELYELLVLRRRWSSSRFGRFVSDLMICQLLDAPDAGS